MAKMAERGLHADLCLIPPGEEGSRLVQKQLAAASYDCVVIGAGIRLPPKSLLLFEAVVNAVLKAAPGSTIAFNTRPEDSAEAVARWLQPD
jgi:hypothetical protein